MPGHVCLRMVSTTHHPSSCIPGAAIAPIFRRFSSDDQNDVPALCPALSSMPSQPALSISISHASFQAELEGAILQQTASVDYYLQTAAPKWSAESYQDDGCGPGGLRSLFMSDLNTSSFQCTYSQVGREG